MRAAAGLLAEPGGELRGIDPARVLFVYNNALTRVRARVHPLCFDSTGLSMSSDGKRRRPVVRVRGRKMLYVVEYSPAFLRATPSARLRTLIHELMHISPFFNGTLSRARRHSRVPQAEFKDMVDGVLSAMPGASREAAEKTLGFRDNVVVISWVRPFSLDAAGLYTDRDLLRFRLFTGIAKSSIKGAQGEESSS